MFKSDELRSSLEQSSYRRTTLHFGGVPDFIFEEENDRRPLRLALIVAILLHLVFFAVKFPEVAAEPRRITGEKSYYLIQQTRFKPPPARPHVEIPKKHEKRRKIPVPDPTPDEPEPLPIEELDVPDTDFTDAVVDLFGVPEGPPDPGAALGAMRMSGNIQPPQKIYGPQPQYTEEGRHARIQGVVILEAVIDATGTVRNVRILKDLPMGLGDSAVDAVSQWKFKPATLEGRPVAVYYTVTVSFTLQ